MQSPPFGILGINNNNPYHTGNPLPKPGQGQGQLAPIPVTNPTNRVSRRGGEGEEQENKENQSKVPEAPRKAEPSQETAHTLLIALMNLSRLFHPESMTLMMTMTYLWIVQELHKTR